MEYCITNMFGIIIQFHQGLSTDHENHAPSSLVFNCTVDLPQLVTCEACDPVLLWHPLVLRKSTGHIHIQLAHRISSLNGERWALISNSFVFEAFTVRLVKSLSAVNVNYVEVFKKAIDRWYFVPRPVNV